MIKKNIVLSILSIFIFSPAYSITLVSVFNGTNYDTGSRRALTLKIENASLYDLGDNYLFLEHVKPQKSDYNSYFYGEWHPRISISKLTDKNINFGNFRDVLLAFELNLNTKSKPVYLYGLGTNIDSSKFKFIKLNLYSRRDTRDSSSTYQVSMAWLSRFSFHERLKFKFYGFVDYVGKQHHLAENLLIKPKLLLDIGELLKLKQDKLFLGARFYYWHNKLGYRHLDESSLEPMISWKV